MQLNYMMSLEPCCDAFMPVFKVISRDAGTMNTGLLDYPAWFRKHLVAFFPGPFRQEMVNESCNVLLVADGAF